MSPAAQTEPPLLSAPGDLKIIPVQEDNSEITRGSIPLMIQADDPVQLIAEPTTLTIGEGDTRHVRIDVAELMRSSTISGDDLLIYPTVAEPLTITASVQGEGQSQLSVEPAAVWYAAGEQLQVSTLSVTAIDDAQEEDEASYTIALSIQGHAEFAQNEITVTVPANDPPVANLRDIDNAPDEVAENSGIHTPVGISIQADNATTYTLSDNAAGRFAISSTGLVTVADGRRLDFEGAATHNITVKASNEVNSQSASLTVSVINVNEITLIDKDGRNNLVRASTGSVVLGMALEATHSDGIPIAKWELRQAVDLFELTQADNSGTQSLRIKADAENPSFLINTTTELSVIARTTHDVTTMAFIVTFTEQDPVLVGELEDIDDMPDEVAENSTANTPVGVTIRADNATTYALTDDAGGRFAISSTGLVTVADGSLLDFEDAAAHTITVEARSINDRRSMPFAIAVIDVNEFGLTQVTDTDTIGNALPENATAGARANITLSATDEDGSAVVTYALIDSNDELFLADTNSGVVTLQGSLNYEQSTQHTIIARAMSDDGSSSTAAFTVNVADVNEFPVGPVADSDPADNELPENALASSYTGITLSATDEDGSAVVTYALIDSNDGLFLADTNTGVVTLRGSLDYELSTRHTVTGQARSSDGSTPTTQTFTIAVTDVNEFPVGPVTDTDIADNTLSENATASSYTGITLSAADEDGSAIVTYALTDSDDGLFLADTNTGIVTLRGPLDYERSTRHTIIARAVSDDGSSSTAAFTVNVTDVNESAVGAVTDTDPAADELPENALASSYTGITLSATDEDGSAIVTYALTDSNDGLFIADADTGIVTLQGSLNYEQSTQHTVIARAMSDDGSSSTAAFTVNVTDVNEFKLTTVTDTDPAADELPENALASSYTGITLSAADEDGSAIVTYALTDSNGGLFAVDGDSGRVTLQGQLDYERSTQYTIIGQARSSDGSSPTTAIFTISVIDVNESAVGPVTDTDTADNTLPENALASSYTGITLSAADEDGSAIVTYALIDSNGGLFIADTDTGIVTLQGQLNYEQSTQHTIIARAMSDDGSSSTAAFTVNVIDVDEFKLTAVADADQDTDNDLPENALASSYIGITLSATDGDGSAVVTYALTDSNDGLFIADTDTGIVTLQGQLDYERSTRHTIIAQARSSDGSAPTTAAFAISVIDVNESAVGPVTDADAVDNTLPENALASSYTGITLSATDGDGSAIVTYALTDSNGGLFAVDGDSGRVTLQGQLDYERSTRHTVIARAMSDDGSSSTAAFTVNVTDVNEFELTAVADSDQDTDNELPENALASSYTGITLSATDGDGSAIVTYALTDSNGGLFLADTNTGVVTLQGQLDYERSTRHIIIAQAMSGDGSYPTTAAFTISVIDVNESAVGPVTDTDTAVNTLPENSIAGSRANITLSATDGDGSAIVTYALTDSNDGLFIADTDTGIVTLRGQLDYERSTRHTVIARAMSDDGSSSTAAFTVNVTDVNEFELTAVADSDQDTDNELPENALASSYTGITLSATDGDGSAIVTYALTDSNGGLFLADTNTGVVTLRGQLDYERSTRHIIIAQAMSGDGSDSTTAAFTISVIDVNESAVGPVTDTDTADNKLSENALASSYTGITLSAADGDGSAIVTYALTDSNGGLFAVDGDSGRVTLRGRLNYEQSTQHTVIARAMSSDGSAPTTRTFTVDVINAQEFALEDTHPDGNTVIARVRAPVEGLLLLAGHPDLDVSDYRWSLGQEADLFEFTQGITGGLTQGLRIRQGADPQPYINQTTELSVILRDAGRGERGDLSALTLTVRIIEAPDIILTPRLAGGMTVAAEAGATSLTLMISPAQADMMVIAFSAHGEGSELITFHPNPVILAPGATTAMTEIRIAADSIITANNRTVIVRYAAGSINRASLAGAAAGATHESLGMNADAASDMEISIKRAQEGNSEIIRGSVPLVIQADDPAQLFAEPAILTVEEGGTRDVRIDVAELMQVSPINGGDSLIYPTMAEPLAITASIQGEGQGQLSVAPTAIRYAAGEQLRVSTLRVTAIDDAQEEDGASYTIALSAQGHAEFARDEITATVPANDSPVANLKDIDDSPDEANENSAANTPVGVTIRADNATTYALTDDAGGRFAISSTGLVTVADGKLLDFEGAATHSITVEAGNEINSQSASLTVSVINVNEITLRDREDENNLVRASTGSVVRGMTLDAAHADGARIVAWELRQVIGVFELTQAADSSTQNLRIKTDAENLSSLINMTTELSVIARTMHDAATTTFTIAFTERDPVLVGELRDTDGAPDEVAENSAANTAVGITVQAANATTYALTDNADGRFAINSSGIVTVADGGPLDFEDAAAHTITVEARSINDSRSMPFAIAVIDVNEFGLTPVTDTDTISNALPEDAAASSYTGITLSAADEDGGAIVTYALTDSNNSLFIADTDTGIVTLRGSLNYEQSTRHTIIARAMSSDGSAPTTAAFTVDVINVNEIILEDIDPASNTVTASANAVVEGLTLKAAHADNIPITRWKITTQTVATSPVGLFELSEPQDSATQTLRIRADANLAPIAMPTTVTIGVIVSAASDEASEHVDIQVFPEQPAEGIRLRIRVYLEGALE